MSERLKVATWNMDCWRRRSSASHREAWAYLDAEVAADIALLQEARVPDGRRAVHGRREIYKGQGWTSLVVTHPPARRVLTARARHSKRVSRLHRTHPGCLAVAEISLPNGRSLTAVSVYGKIDDGYAQTTMHRLLSDLTPLFDQAGSRRDRWLVMGGDLNVSTQLPAPYGRWSDSVFDRIEAFGLVNLTARAVQRHPERRVTQCECGDAPCLHVQTATHRTGTRYQNDYLFASEALAERLDDCIVLEAGGRHSDHWPVVATFSI
jgi:exonuclease III